MCRGEQKARRDDKTRSGVWECLLVFYMKFILGKKLDMTQVFRDDGRVVPVTRVAAGPCVVAQIKIKEKDGVMAVQLGFGAQKQFRLSKSLQGHLRDLAMVRWLRDFRTTETEQTLKRGQVITVGVFTPGEKVQVVGWSKGKGFQGVVKRHGFRGGPATHGHKDNLRMPGTIGAGGVQRVFKDVRMGGHMGAEQVTVKNLEIVAVDSTTNEVLIKGALPGAYGSLLLISTAEGMMELEAIKEQGTSDKEQQVVSTSEQAVVAT